MDDTARYLDHAAAWASGCVSLLLERGADPRARLARNIREQARVYFWWD